MQDLEKLLDKETVENISKLVLDKMPILNQIKEFKNADQKFAEKLEELENTLSEELNNDLDEVMRLHYNVIDYYLTFAYFLGLKQGEQIQEL